MSFEAKVENFFDPHELLPLFLSAFWGELVGAIELKLEYQWDSLEIRARKFAKKAVREGWNFIMITPNKNPQN